MALMSRLIQKRPITDLLLATLRATGRPIGDCQAPRNGTAGWVGQPNAEGTNFIAYSVLTAVNTPPGTGTLNEPNQDVWFSYALTSFGVSRVQCEDQADLVRKAALLISKQNVVQWDGTPEEYGRRIQTVVVQSYGPVQPMGDTDPRTYAQTDTVSLWTTG
jgi:hypothetical protein